MKKANSLSAGALFVGGMGPAVGSWRRVLVTQSFRGAGSRARGRAYRQHVQVALFVGNAERAGIVPRNGLGLLASGGRQGKTTRLGGKPVCAVCGPGKQPDRVVPQDSQPIAAGAEGGARGRRNRIVPVHESQRIHSVRVLGVEPVELAAPCGAWSIRTACRRPQKGIRRRNAISPRETTPGPGRQWRGASPDGSDGRSRTVRG